MERKIVIAAFLIMLVLLSYEEGQNSRNHGENKLIFFKRAKGSYT